MKIKFNYGFSIASLSVSFICNIILFGFYFSSSPQKIVDQEYIFALFGACAFVVLVISFCLGIISAVKGIIRKEKVSVGAHLGRIVLILIDLFYMSITVIRSIVLINYMFGYEWSYH